MADLVPSGPAPKRSPLELRLEAARAFVQPTWDPTRAAHLVLRASARQRRAQITRALGISAVAIAAGMLLSWATDDRAMVAEAAATTTTPSVAEAPPPAPSGVLSFADGSRVEPLGPDTEVLVEAVRPSAVELELAHGAARFEVTPGLPRAFAVQAAHVTVSVVGTIFVVERLENGARPDVTVEVVEGTVRVAGEGFSVLLRAGERRVFRGADAVAVADPVTVALPHEAAPERSPVAVAPVARVRRRAVVAPDGVAPGTTGPVEEEVSAGALEPETAPLAPWRALADEGRFDEGYALLLSDRDVLRSDQVEILLLAADCARLSGHPAESLAYLRRALEVGESDPRAPSVAFTLGRVLLQQLGRPVEAAEAFARARAIAPSGSLASDALSREVEAWQTAGDGARARARAEEYLERYPDGVHAAAVRRHGGLE